ncbi:hypothetical protein ED312_10115 [Sinomicrobium pectinilyticum]|uniref:Uncharacterized protein n=1 Tax=Sinomicrobium pectinilyticum TaxID=1084421 RepID=A0A3N0EJ50_SINP1|nr:DUF6520 family protein [Sinomicrobium pectinilyticum]RNL87747.1 hypothetical protein ED312_10115 [Sinomicrobium pectinilyticum]
MKTKQLILGSLVFVFAVGTAFASLLAPQKVYVEALVDRPSGPNQECVPLQAQCEDSGFEACAVELINQPGAPQTSNTYSDSNCTMPLQNITGGIIQTIPDEADIEIIALF